MSQRGHVNSEEGIDGWVEEVAGALGGDRYAAEAFAARVPAGYPQQVAPDLAAVDARHLATLAATPAAAGGGPAGAGGPLFALRPEPGADGFRLRRYGRGAVELSAFLPVLESFGLVVVEAVPMAIGPGPDGTGAHIDDFGLRPTAGAVLGDRDAERLVEAIRSATAGDAEVDSLNRLVLAARLDWVQVRLLRAYRRYRRQAGSPYTDEQLDDPLVAYPEVARDLVALVEARFAPEPAATPPGGRPGGAGSDAEVRARLAGHLAEVGHLEADQVLRSYLGLVDATLRTSYLLRSPGGGPLPTVTLKLASRHVPDLPLPHPMVETWVHGPDVEGIHLRFGAVARGGIRWSDRPEDFRTEVLDLAAAQVKKNAVIVPTGAKGGFVCRGRTPPGAGGVRQGYETFISSLLDITDNYLGGRVVGPPGVVALDGEDPYLVVAADKGTASFSDAANALAGARQFWLGDAFASGGSHGYDHKAMGITARGAWVAVRRHFHQLGVDVQTETITVAGIGDMSGDVFGNGMLQSPALALVAAFDHRHVFLDPDPDPKASFAERQRLAGSERSSWDDYDRSVISAGGGVWPRDAKSVPLGAEARRALGVTAAELSPPELISAILRSPVDLLWFGGIGTYIKDSGEPDSDVGDHANDAVRVTADQVRARVVAEGGNLGVTQRGRIRYSRRGGRINTDFIDNAAGVATSDREVNLKILIDLAISEGRLEASERDLELQAAEPFVAGAVLGQVDHSVSALNRAVPGSARELDAYEALLDDFGRRSVCDRGVEHLPDAEELARRRRAGAGLIRPELAVVLAFAKRDLIAAVETSGMADDPAALDAVRAYFPPRLLARFDDLVARHRLYRQLVATDVAGDAVDQMGPVWVHETAAELGRSLGEVAAAYWAARQVLGAGPLLERIEKAANSLGADAESSLHAAVTGAVGRLARRYLLQGPVAVSARLARDGELAAGLIGSAAGGPTGPAGAGVAAVAGVAAGAAQADPEVTGAADDLARAVAARSVATDVADAQSVAESTGVPPTAALAGFAALDAAVAGRLLEVLGELEVPGRWAAWQLRALVDEVCRWRVEALVTAVGSPGRAGAAGPVVSAPAGEVTPAGAAGAATSPEAVRAAAEEWLAPRRSALGGLDDLLDRLVGLQRGEAGERRSVDTVALASVAVRRLPR